MDEGALIEFAANEFWRAVGLLAVSVAAEGV
jgi:hypothetical protein